MIEIEDAPVKCPITTKLVLDEDEETKEPLVQVHRNIVTKLKPHQVDGKKIGQKTRLTNLCVYVVMIRARKWMFTTKLSTNAKYVTFSYAYSLKYSF